MEVACVSTGAIVLSGAAAAELRKAFRNMDGVLCADEPDAALADLLRLFRNLQAIRRELT